MKIHVLTLSDTPKIIPAPINRDWMDASHQRFAYRCLPLSIANAHGWWILNKHPVEAEWNGGMLPSDVVVHGGAGNAVAHFGHGVLTFHVNALFRTEEDIDLHVGPPANYIKDGIQCLSGVIETDWTVSSFTLNWKFTRPGRVRFDVDEPLCQFQPVRRGAIEKVFGSIMLGSSKPVLMKRFEEWSQSRQQFNADLHNGAEDAVKQGWQKDYLRGDRAPKSHRTKLKLHPFKIDSHKQKK